MGNSFFFRVQPGRELLLEKKFPITRSNSSHEVYLFSDLMMVVVSPKRTILKPLEEDNIDMMMSKDEKSFELIINGESFSYTSESDDERANWIQVIFVYNFHFISFHLI